MRVYKILCTLNFESYVSCGFHFRDFSSRLRATKSSKKSFLHNFVYFLNLLLKPVYSCSFYLQKEFPVRNTLSSYFLTVNREASELYFSFSNIVTRSV